MTPARRIFLREHLPVKQMLHAHSGNKEIEMIFLINAPIVKVKIEEMLYDPEDIAGQTHGSMMACFQNVSDESGALPDYQWLECYCVVIKNQLLFSLAVVHLSVRLSFRQVAHLLRFMRERSGLAGIGLGNESTIPMYAPVACAVGLQKRITSFSRKFGRSPLP